MTDIQLIQPEWLWLIPLIALTPWLIKRGYLETAGQQIPATPVKHPLTEEVSVRTARYGKRSQLLVITSACLILLTLAQPVKQGAQLSSPPVPVDIMLIIDTSVSMVLDDYQLDGQTVDRMTMTQVLLDRFTRHYSGKRIGIVVLGDKPHILLQPSEDHELVRHLIHRLKPTVAGRQAALGDAVAVAAKHVNNSDEGSPDTVMVMISDGVLPSGNLSPVEGARRAAESGATLHTIAIGAISMRDSEQASLLYEPADTGLLQEMAQITGGSSFHAVDAAAMDSALRVIEEHQEKSATLHPALQLQEALYIWPLGLAIVLLAINGLLPYLNTRGRSS